MGRDADTTQATGAAAPPDAAPRFPRLELPPFQGFRNHEDDDVGDAPRPAARPSADAIASLPPVVRLLDEPAWSSPVPAPVDPEAEYRAMLERVAAYAPHAHTTRHAPVIVAPATATPNDPAPDPEPSGPQQEPRPSVVPQLEDPASIVRPAARSTLALVLVVATAALLVWASRMAFSPALLALASLLVAQLAAAEAAASRRPLLPAAGAGILALLAAKGAIAGFGEMAFVAGLFVLVAAVPTLLLFGVVQVVLRRQGEAAAPADLALRSGWKLRAGALAATIVAGVQAHRSFSAVPDAIVALGIVALVVVTLAAALRAPRGA